MRLYIADIAVVARGGAEGPEGGEEEAARRRLRAMSACFSPNRALMVYGASPQQALLAAAYLTHQARQRALTLPTLMPSSAQVLWQADTKLKVGFVFIGHESNIESLLAMVFLARHSAAHDGRRVTHCYSLRSARDDVYRSMESWIAYICM